MISTLVENPFSFPFLFIPQATIQSQKPDYGTHIHLTIGTRAMSILLTALATTVIRCYLLFKPVRESLKVIKSATKSNVPDPQARANVLREHVRIIGNFIRTLLDEDTVSLESRLW